MLAGGKTKQWLPVAVENGMEATTDELQTRATDYYNDAAPFTTLTKEQTSSARPLSLLQTGETWQDHAATAAYGVNQANEVLRFRVTSGGIEQDGYYPAATLHMQTKTDADGRSTTTYADAAGNAVLLRMADGALTYRVYDDMDRLRYVLPPAVMTQLPQGLIEANDSILRLYAYTYRYDRRGNLIYKRLPGCEPVYMVYDRTGRAVLSQDGNQRARGDYWTVFKYDFFGRLAYTSEVLTENETHEEKIQKFADWSVVETFSANEQAYPMENTGYSRNFYHVHPTKLLTVSYYDNYDFLQLLPADTLQALTYEEKTLYGTRHENATGLLTGSRVYSLEDSLCTITVYYYNQEGRVIQQRTVTHTGTYEITHTAYHFDGSVSRTLHEQGDITERYLYTYDHAGRPLKTLYTIDEDKTTLLADNHYNNIGQLTEKRRHDGQDTIRYHYDIRGALTQLHSGDFSETLFYADSLPDWADANYSGNIAAAYITNGATSQQWQYSYDNRNRLTQASLLQGTTLQTSEQFSYDDMGNLLTLRRYGNGLLIDDLDYHYNGNQLSAIVDYVGSQDRYNLKEYSSGKIEGNANAMHYDANGNLIYDTDRGICVIRYNLLNLPDTIQFMNGNQIVNVYDAAGRKLRTTSYTLTEPLATPATRVLQLAYSLGNVKETTTIYNGNIVSSYTLPHKDLIGRPHTYYIYNSEGYITRFSAHTLKIPRFTWYYYHRDHLGNNVAVWNATVDSTVQRTFYHASGLPMSCSTGQSTQNRKYNGKEYVEDHGYDVYDYGFRGYYATIGRFTCIDPLAEQTPWQSPYVYADNNFINNVDLWGLSAIGSSNNLHANIPTIHLNWVAVDEDGNVVDWGDDEDDYHVYLVDEFWDGTYAGLEGYEMIGWEIRPADFCGYTIGSPCYYWGSYTQAYVGTDGLTVIGLTRLMYGNKYVNTQSNSLCESSLNIDLACIMLLNDALSVAISAAEIQSMMIKNMKLGRITRLIPSLCILNDVYIMYEEGISAKRVLSLGENVISLLPNVYVASAVFLIDVYGMAFNIFVDNFNKLQSEVNCFGFWGDIYLNGF